MMGRPKKYTDKWIKRMAVKMLQYVKNAPLPLKQDFASQNKFSSQRLSEFCKIPEFSDALKRFEDVQQKKIIGAAMLGKINVTMAIFTLKNVAGWRDVQEIKGGNQTSVNVFPNKTVVFKDIDESAEAGNRNIHEPQSAEGSRG